MILGKIKYLESIRGIGALSVVFFHFLEIFFPAFLTGNPAQQHLGGGLEWLVYSTPLRLLVNGPAAVTVFFVLSGYVLTYKFFKTKDTENLTSGAIRRYFRLAPVVLAVELLAYLCLRFSLYQYVIQIPTITYANTWINAYNTPADLRKVLYEALAGVFFGYQNQYDVPLWTMTYEFYGSLLVFSAAFVGSKMRNRMWLFVALVFFFRDSYYSDFVLGMILSDLSQRPDQPLRRWIQPWLNTILGVAGLFLLSFPTYTNYADQTMYAFMHIHSL
jgi:peptidoglycan/LPS O-acetylase OafA/YrhL